MKSIAIALLIGCALIAGGCRAAGGAEGDTPQAKRQVMQSETQKALDEFYAARPDGREKINRAAGYGYFSNVNVNVLLMSTENGYGVVHNNSTGQDTYMKMAGAGVGVGMGVKDYRAIMVFNDSKTMNDFINTGVTAGASGDAAAKTSNEGGATNAGATIGGMEVYQFTKQGLALQATVQGTKYWKDDSLNSGQ